MSVLTTKVTHERVEPVAASTLRRTVTCLGANRWQANGLWGDYPNAHAALLAIREDVLRTARHPTDIEILWANVPANFVAPTTGTAL